MNNTTASTNPSNKLQTPIPAIDLDEARYFLDLLAPGEEITFQTFDDPRPGQPKRPGRAKVFHGTFDEHKNSLVELNSRGAGIFFMVNEGDGEIHEGERTCRTAGNVIRVRSLFADLDGSPLEPVRASTLHPNIIVNSSPGRWHAYWRVSGCSLTQFKPLQDQLAAKFNSDPNVADLPRVMRMPGFLHQKEAPFLTTVIFPLKEAA
ncbi:MAG: DNA-primase RepB domain-containing protein [Proteobacteria bacterium]|nr:DNA-primase RepB domain-containing protein [Pseudomonadota bacterium]